MNSLVDILDKHSIPYRTSGPHTRAGWVQFQCVFCGGGRTRDKPYMGWNSRGNYCSCWQCGPHSTLDVIRAITGLPWNECKELAGGMGEPGLRDLPRAPGKLVIPNGVGPLLEGHRNYLAGRGLDPNKCEQLWGVQGIGLAIRLQWRLFLPIHYRGKVVSWTTRSVSDNAPLRYVSAGQEEESINHRTLLYGEDHCRHSIIVMEGPLDVINVGPGAAGTFGLVFTKAQIRKMAKYPRRAVCFDNEPEAQEKAKELCRLLEPFHGRTERVVLDAPDPGSASKDEVKRLRRIYLDD